MDIVADDEHEHEHKLARTSTSVLPLLAQEQHSLGLLVVMKGIEIFYKRGPQQSEQLHGAHAGRH